MGGSHEDGHHAQGTEAHGSGPAGAIAGARPFTLQEALPYSPQSSVVPFTPDLIPSPTIGSGLPSDSIAHLFNRHEFDALNRQATGSDGPTKEIKSALDHVMKELRPNQRTFYKFKKITKPLLDPIAPAYKGDSLYTGMSPMSTMVLDRGPLFIKQSTATATPTPGPPATVAPSALTTNGQGHAAPRPSSSRIDSPQVAKQTISNAEAHRHNQAKFEIAISSKSFDSLAYAEITEQPDAEDGPPKPDPDTTSAPVPAPPRESSTQNITAYQPPAGAVPDPNPASTKASLEVAISNPQIRKEEYLDVPEDLDEPSNLSSRKRERDRTDDDQDTLGQNLNKKQRADTALYELDRLSKDVFDSVACALQQQQGHGHVVNLTSEGAPSLTSGCHQKLQTAVHKVINLGAYNHVPLDTLFRMQRLSEAGLRTAKGLDYRIDDSWGESDVQNWIDQLPELETGLKAARTALRIMCGGREEKQLYSEELIELSIDLFKGVIDGVVVPIVELRGSGATSAFFKLLTPHKKMIASVLTNCQRLFALFAELVHNIQLSEMAIGTLEFTASNLIFVDNAYYEKDSVVGVQKFDGIRLVAMDMLCQIFLIKPDQRRGIFNDLLTSLEKLPVGKQSARQFRLSEGGSIQPLSALIMRLVQASSGRTEERKQHTSLPQDDDDDDDELSSVRKTTTGQTFTIRTEEDGAQQHHTAVEELEDAVKPLIAEVHSNSSYVVNFIVSRALKSTKSGDTPYRNLLDLFVEDFTTCMDSPDWPAAELMLRQMTYSMLRLWEDPKSAAPAKSMALEILGVMATATSKLRSHVRKVAESKEFNASDELGQFLSELSLSALDQKDRPEHLVYWSGPFRAGLEYLEERCAQDPHLRSAITYFISDWAQRAHLGYHSFNDDYDARDQEYGRLAFRLRKMIEDRSWLSTEYTFKAVTLHLAKLSYAIILLRSPFCELFPRMMGLLIGAMATDQATVRSKALKSINHLIETDPAMLDGDSSVVKLIINCTNDSSPQVRDSAIGLMGKCMQLRSHLEAPMTERILNRFVDSGVGVRKRAMKLARDIYLRNLARETRSKIANGLLLRVQDPDESVRDLAKQMIEEVWFAPFYVADDTATFKISLTDHVSLMVQTVKSGNVANIMDKVLQTILKSTNKAQHGPFGVSVKLVANMFELIDTLDSDDPSIPHGRDALQVLQIFAKADPKLFSFEEIRLLRPHLASFTTADDIAVFRATVVIYRQVLPQLSSKHAEFLKEVREQLQKSIGKLMKHILDDVIACLWIIGNLLDQLSPLAKLAASSLRGIKSLKASKKDDPIPMFERYSQIVGMVGKHCDLDKELQQVKGNAYTTYQGTSVAKLMVDVLAPWAEADEPLRGRKAALEAIGLICQAHPRNYVSPNVYPKFEQVFKEKNPVLESAVLRSFKEFLLIEERRSEAASAAAAEGNGPKKDRNLTVMGGTSHDDVASATTQRFLKHITRIALTTLDEHAFLAVEVLGSINRQGLVHPKETGVTLITLETAPVQRISEVAYMEHRALHEKYETVVEREYVKAVQAAFNYQRDVVHDTHGATRDPFQSKLYLLMEALKISKSKNRQKFIDKLISQIDFDFTKLDVTQDTPTHVEFARFVIENIAFFDYMTIGEVHATVNGLEKLVTSTGSNLAQIVESEVFNVRMDMAQPSQSGAEETNEGQGNGQTAEQAVLANIQVPPGRLRQMTAGAMVLLSLWEARTYLRRLYGLGTNRKETKVKASSKDMSKTPVKVQGITGDKFWEEVSSHMDAFASQESMIKTCQTFVELLNVDKEFKIEEEDDMNGGPSTPSEGGDDDMVDGYGRKRKAGSNTPGGRKKRARSDSKPRPRGRPRKNHLPEDEEDADGDLDFDLGGWD